MEQIINKKKEEPTLKTLSVNRYWAFGVTRAGDALAFLQKRHRGAEAVQRGPRIGRSIIAYFRLVEIFPVEKISRPVQLVMAGPANHRWWPAAPRRG
jgi:hypothetical protein